MTVQAVRGAIMVEVDTAVAIRQASLRLAEEVRRRNQLEQADVISIILSMTRDLTTGHPATALRLGGYGDAPLFCVQEAYVVGQPSRVIRIMITYRTPRRRAAVPVYLDGAEALRPDLFGGP